MPIQTPALAKHGKFGFQLQEPLGDAEGIDIAEVDPIWLPLCEDPTFELQVNSTLIDQADAHEWDYLEHSAGQWYSGTLAFHLYPHVAGLADLLDWIQTRTTGNQGEFAHVWMIDRNGALIRGAKDVKVNTAEFTFARGAPIRCSLDLTGKKPAVSVPSGDDLTDPVLEAYPFLMKDGSFQYVPASGGANVGYSFKEATVRIDTGLQDPAEGMRWDGSYNPYALYNEGGLTCSGNFTRDFQDQTLYDAWLKAHEIGAAAGWYAADYDGALTITIARGVSLELEMPRVRLQHVATGQRGSRRGAQDERDDFVALGSLDGTVAPITLT